MKIRKIAISQIKPSTYNPRQDLKLGDPEYDKMRKSIQDFDLVEPLVWNEATGNLVGGHQRLKILTELGRKEVEVSVVNIRDRRKEKALNIALNKILGDWDYGKLKDLLSSLDDGEFDTAMTGFGAEEFEELMTGGGKGKSESGDDDIPSTPAKARTKQGQLWELGDHKLMVGDATSKSDFEALMGRDIADMVWTDPPYGVSYEPKDGRTKPMKGDEKRGDNLVNRLLLPALRLAARFSRSTAAFYIWHASSTREDFVHAMKMAGLFEKQYLIWAKPGIALSYADYRWAHEPCFYAAKSGHSPDFWGDRAQPTVWRAALKRSKGPVAALGNGIVLLDGKGGKLLITGNPPKAKRYRMFRLLEGQAITVQNDESAGTLMEVSRDAAHPEHPTQKPVELAIRAMENSSQPGQVVLDMFMGSGTAIIAAERSGRRARGMELEPKYADITIQRYEKCAGKKANLAGRNYGRPPLL